MQPDSNMLYIRDCNCPVHYQVKDTEQVLEQLHDFSGSLVACSSEPCLQLAKTFTLI